MLALLLTVAAKPIDLTFVRHGETVANATGKYNSRTLNTLSALGEKQVKELTPRLARQPKFDAILVSPSPRALKTIAPYLAQTRQKATIWPELYECCTERPKQKEAKTFSYGAKIELGPELAPFFIVPDGAKYPAPRNYGEGLAQVRVSLDQFRSRYAGMRVLVVGHSAHGGLFLKGLDGKSRHVKNAEEIRLTVK